MLMIPSLLVKSNQTLLHDDWKQATCKLCGCVHIARQVPVADLAGRFTGSGGNCVTVQIPTLCYISTPNNSLNSHLNFDCQFVEDSV